MTCYAGVVSLTLLEAPLFGPPHVHLQPPTRAHFIGDLSPHSNPAHYITAVQSLHDWYLNQSAEHSNKGRTRPPLVINTHGWIKVALLLLWPSALHCHAVSIAFLTHCRRKCCEPSCATCCLPRLSSNHNDILLVLVSHHST